MNSAKEKMLMAAVVTGLISRRGVELMSIVHKNKTAASKPSFASFSFPLFQINILIKLRPKQKTIYFYF